MKNIILLHDAFAKPTQYWYSKLGSIAPNGYSVISPELASGAEQGMEYWMKSIGQYTEKIDQDTIVISHGISSLLVLRFLETIKTPIRMYISIAGCSEAPGHQALAPIAETFLQTPIDWKLITEKINSVIHVWNAADPFIDIQLSKHFAELLPGKNIVLNGHEHFTDTAESELFDSMQAIFQEITQSDSEKDFLQKNQLAQQEKIDMVQSSIPAIVTYDTDVAQSVAGYQGKVISELLETARAKEKEKEQSSIKNPQNIFYILGTIILILLGIGILGYEIQSKLPTLVQRIESPNKKYETPLLRVEQIVPIELAGIERFKLLTKLKENQLVDTPEKTFVAIVPTQNGNRASLQGLIDSFDMKFPVGFAGKANDFVYGHYKPQGADSGAAFLLVDFDGYDTLYSIMRNWEPDIIYDTQILFAPNRETTSLIKAETPEFTDIIINNIPMRVATLLSGETIAYGFLTDRTLLITTSTDIAEPLLRRIIGR